MWSLFSTTTYHFPYEYDKKNYYTDPNTVFTVHKGKNKRGDIFTIFKYDKKTLVGLLYAKNTIQRLKTLRHPNILKYVAEFEADNAILLATEHVTPLRVHLNEINYDKETMEKYLAKGIMDIIKTVAFLNNDAKLRHNNLFAGSIYVTDAGEWKLGDVGFMSGIDDPYPTKLIDMTRQYNPPEEHQDNEAPCPTADSWGIAIFLWEIYNGGVLKDQSNLKSTYKLPSNLLEIYLELMGTPGSRMPLTDVLDRCTQPRGFFDNDLIHSLHYFEDLHLKNAEEKMLFFSSLGNKIKSFPPSITIHKMLPALQLAISYGDAGATVINPILKISEQVNGTEQYEKVITPCLVSLFESNDRTVRCKLLQSIPTYIEKMSAGILNTNIFPNYAKGFLDTHPAIRDLSIKGVPYFAPYLDNNNLNTVLMQHFARLQSKDEMEEIRASITICLGKIAHYLDPAKRPKILLSAFIRALHDPCHKARVAGINAFILTQEFFYMQIIADKIMPQLCPLTVDSDVSVRESALNALKIFIDKLEALSANPCLKDDMEKRVNEKESRANWGNWAVDTLTTTLGATLGLRGHTDPSEEKVTASPKLNLQTTPVVQNTSGESTEGWSNFWAPYEISSFEEGTNTSRPAATTKPSTTTRPQGAADENLEINRGKEEKKRRERRGESSSGRPSGPLKLGVKKT